jgi:methionine biosynthesis protein MetW
MATPASSTETNGKMYLKAARLDYRIILDMVTPGSSVLDLGCGDGTLLALLVKERNVRGQGIEIDEKAIYHCVGKGLSVFQGDVDSGLSEYPDGSFDSVILNQSFQQVKNPDKVLGEAMRVGKQVIVGFPNFANATARWQLGVRGRAPVTASLPYQWYNTPNTHFFSISDFRVYCLERRIKIIKMVFITGNRVVRFLPNIFADVGIFLIGR